MGGGGQFRYLSPLSPRAPLVVPPSLREGPPSAPRRYLDGVEIERKFLVERLPDLTGESRPIEQGYLAIGADSEVRLRRDGGELMLTVKRGSGLSREEREIPLEPGDFERLWPLTEGRRLSKHRHLIRDGAWTIELDVYDGGLEGLAVAEIEFPSEEAAAGFDRPRWLGAEVTDDESYKNQSLAIRGAPAGGN